MIEIRLDLWGWCGGMGLQGTLDDAKKPSACMEENRVRSIPVVLGLLRSANLPG